MAPRLVHHVLGRARDADELAGRARLLWSVIHGVVQIATTPKFGLVEKSTTAWMIETAISECLRKQHAAKGRLRVEPDATGATKRERRAN